MRIRPVEPADYPALAALETVVFGYPATAEGVADEVGVPSCACFVAEVDGQIIGKAATGFMPNATPAGDVRVQVIVHPDHRRQGIGRALWEALQPVLAERRPAHLRANGNAKDPDSLAWAQRRGFALGHHHMFQSLDLTAVDLGALPDSVPGFRFVAFAELRTPETERRLWELNSAAHGEVPDAADWDEEPFEEWRAWMFGEPGGWPEGCLIALAPNGEWAGFTLMQKGPSESAHIFMTVVLNPYRGQGLSVALKVAAAKYAAAQGIKRLTTLNHADNTAILATNRRLGYQVDEDLYRLVKRYA